MTDLVYSGLWEYIKDRVLGVQRVKTKSIKTYQIAPLFSKFFEGAYMPPNHLSMCNMYNFYIKITIFYSNFFQNIH